MFGRNGFNGYVLARRQEDQEIEGLPGANDTNARDYVVELPPGPGSLQALERLAKLPILRGNEAELLIDGEEAWVGGLNVGEEHLGLDPHYGPWRDTHARIAGPAVLAAQLSFVEDWHWATDEVPALRWQVAEPAPGDIPILVLPSGPADRRETAGLAFTHAIHAARERVWLASPYFVPDESVLAALQLAALRGVDVRILIPDEPDQVLVYLAAYSFVEELSGFDVELYRYEAGFLHQKVMLVDDTTAAVGTANFDNRSFRLNFEITLLFFDRQFAREVEASFIDDFRRSRLMREDEVQERSFWFRLATRLARLAAPIL